ncbi:MAG TPA: pyridoxal phosphate-dependent aminotransferase [Candidatus Acidoferrum sp.]|nr:pyridoxal phosphate-dependent aminotransferase [Candidatus Acidoferrum sp.]
MKSQEILSNGSRRTFLQLSAAATAAMAFRIATEATLAADERHVFHPGAVIIDANENPLGPCDAARKAIVDLAPQGGRYSYWLHDEFVKTFAEMEGIKPEYLRVFPGSSEPLHFSVLAFTSPTKSYVTADPGYEAGMKAAGVSGARVVKTLLTKSYAHDIKAMLAAAPDAGLFYVCTPNNPTGTMTSHSDIEQLLAAKPKGSIVLVDEAYIHFSDGTSALDLVKADQDVIVLRTFSKIYGMAGIRCGAAIARPDLLAKLGNFSGWSAMPITALAAATASLRHEHLVPERKQLNASIRQKTFDRLSSQGYTFTPSQSNCFMLETKRPAKEIIDGMAKRNVYIGRPWPVWPTHVRITVGTQQEMDAFHEAFQAVMKNSTSTGYAPSPTLNRRRSYSDGQSWPSV